LGGRISYGGLAPLATPLAPALSCHETKQQARLHRSDDSTIIVRLAEPLSCKASVETTLALFKRHNGFSSLLQQSKFCGGDAPAVAVTRELASVNPEYAKSGDK